MSLEADTKTTVLAADFPEYGRSGHSSLSLDELAQRVDAIARSHGGSMEKALGNSFLLGFSSPDPAVRCAFSLMKAFPAVEREAASSLLPRIGIHSAEAQDLGEDLIGKAPDGAVLLRSLARPGMIYASSEVVSATLASGSFSAAPLRLNSSLPGWLSGFLIQAPEAEPPKAQEPSPQPRSLAEIRASILDATKEAGRRLSVDEARRAYSWYGPEADEVIASLADSGILARSPRGGVAAPDDANRADLGKSIETAVHAIVAEIERSVKENAAGVKASHASDEGSPPRRNQKKRSSPKTKASNDIDSYRAELEKSSKRKRRAIIPGILGFLVFGGALGSLYITQRTDFLWAPILAILWAGGLIKSFIAAVMSTRQAKEAQALPSMDAASLKELKSLNSQRDSIGKHFVNAISLPLLFGYIGMVYSPGEVWPLIASAGVIGIFILRFLRHIGKVPSALRAFFSKAGIVGGRKGLEEARRRRRATEAEPNLGSYAEVYETARRSASDIEAAMAEMDPKSLDEMRPQLDAYLGQVRLLAKTASELDTIIEEIPMAELARDKAELLKKAEGSEPGLKAQYVESAREISSQEASFAGLKEQRELIGLRLESSVNQLTQLKLDLAKAKAADSQGALLDGESALAGIRARSKELSSYLEDLRSGQLEALADPFAELERKLADDEKAKTAP